MEKGDIVKVTFTAREESSGNIFDTTSEKVAKEAGIFKEGAIYRAIPVVVGAGDLIKGLEAELEKMSEGEQKEITLEPEQAFGERKKELVVQKLKITQQKQLENLIKSHAATLKKERIKQEKIAIAKQKQQEVLERKRELRKKKEQQKRVKAQEKQNKKWYWPF